MQFFHLVGLVNQGMTTTTTTTTTADLRGVEIEND